MWVNPEFRQRGIGRSLVQHGLNFLRLAGQTEVSLGVARGRPGVLAFYQSLGFRENGVTRPLRPGADILVDELRCSLDDPAGSSPPRFENET
jgi:ribosomal protein S18 acetylase RimI-like enzyme